MMRRALVFAWRRLRRGNASGELLILSLALVVAMAAATAVGLFSDRVRRAVQVQSGDAIGGDALISRRDRPDEALLASLRGLGLRLATTVELTSVVLSGDDTLLVSVKAADAGYPLRGALRIADAPYAAAHEERGLPPAGSTWVDVRVLQALHLAVGATLQLGQSSFRIAGVIEYEPDRGSGFSDLAPRVLIRSDELTATGLVGLGSRVQYTLLLAGDQPALDRAAALPLPPGSRYLTPQNAKPEVGRALGRAGQFLDIAVLAAVLLAAAAVALSARQHGLRQRDEIAVLKCLGASSRFVGLSLVLQLLMLGLAAAVVGAAIGYASQRLLAQLLARVIDTPLPAASLRPLLAAGALQLMLLLGFALPPLMAARRVSPIRVFQRDEPRGSGWTMTLAAVTASVALLWWQAGDATLALWVLGGALGAALLLALMASGLVALLTPLRRAGHTALRFGLGNIARRRGASITQVVALGVALLAMLLLGVVQHDLLDAWRQRVPADAPNQFLINIQPGQVAPLQAFFTEHGIATPPLWPMARGRLAAIDGKPVTAESFEDPETRRWINREFNLSWTAQFGDDNRLLQGRWWPADTVGQPELSIDQYVVDRLHVGLGSKLRLMVADREIDLTVTSIRKVKWESFKPNFFLVTPPGVIDRGDAGAAQYITAFHLPAERRALLAQLIRAFPNVTAIDLEATLSQVRSIVDRIVGAVQFLFAFALAAGACVLLAAIESTRAERVRETALLRTLGARRRTIALGLVTEYAVLGLLSGLVAAAAAQIIAWVLAIKVFDLPYHFSPVLWLAGAFGGASLVALLGWWSLRRVLDTPPRIVLAAA